MARQDGSTFDLDATNAAARDEGPTRRTVHSDGSVSVLAEESRDLTGTKARARTEALRREEAIPEVLRADRDLVKGYLAEVDAEIDEALADPEAFDADEATAEAEFDAAVDAAGAETPILDTEDTESALTLHDGCGSLTWADGNFCINCGEALSSDDDERGPEADDDDDDGGGTAVTVGGSAGPDDYPPDHEGSVVEPGSAVEPDPIFDREPQFAGAVVAGEHLAFYTGRGL